MKYKHEDAREKICPFRLTSVFPQSEDGVLMAVTPDDYGGMYLCLGVNCMAWQMNIGIPEYGYCGLIRHHSDTTADEAHKALQRHKESKNVKPE